MEASGDDDAVLSDVEGDDPSPAALLENLPPDATAEKLRETLLELERERQARQEAEKTKTDLQQSFSRLKVLAHEAIKKRDESGKQRDEALREKEEAVKARERVAQELADALKAKEEALKQRDEMARTAEETARAKDSSRAEIETAAQMLVSGSERIATKVSTFKNFSGTLPRSSKYTGLPAIAYGVIKRVNEIVEELLKQVESAAKGRDDVRVQMEQRNYEIAIEVSQLESTINELKEQLAKRTSELESLEKSAAAKDARMAEVEREALEKLSSTEQECQELRRNLEEQTLKALGLESKIEAERPLLFEQLNYISKTHEQLYNIIRMVDVNVGDQPELSEDLFLPQKLDLNENLRTSLSGTISAFEFAKTAAEKVSSEVQDRSYEKKELQERISHLVMEKKHVGTLLRSALSKRIAAESVSSDGSSKEMQSRTNVVLKVAENGLRKSGLDIRLDSLLEGAESIAADDKLSTGNKEEDEVFGLAAALENIVRASQLEIMELRKTVETLRAEAAQLKGHIESLAKEIAQKKQQIKILEEKERSANENVEGLMMDISAAEEEITRWKVAAEQEAAAGKAVEDENQAKVEALKQELEDAKERMRESESKLKFKEETAAAAMAARDAAESSLRLADARATRLRERLEELTRQLEELENRGDSNSRQRSRYVCWPWQWLGLQFVGHHGDVQQSSNEMELSEPLL
ncbi:Uncharacterized protein EJ110_NYTH41061 [Nymphaea thermarum]|nr:Uncharacterized protein EJ110_NYTH41061 [Nymphaea thermarum]